MSDDALVKKITDAMWEAIDDKGIEGRLWYDDCQYLAGVAVQALGLRREIRQPQFYKDDPAERWVTDWKYA